MYRAFSQIESAYLPFQFPKLARGLQSSAFAMQTSNLTALKALPSHEAMYPHGLTSLAIPSKRMPNLIQSLGTTSIQEFQESKFVRPQSVYYELEGQQKRWYGCDPHQRHSPQAM
jgi:hypothetical protein